jgi:hypothetical protein
VDAQITGKMNCAQHLGRKSYGSNWDRSCTLEKNLMDPIYGWMDGFEWPKEDNAMFDLGWT